MIEDENTAWLISWLESKISDYTYYRPHRKWIRYHRSNEKRWRR